MKTCREISELVSQSLDRRLPWSARWAVRVHFLYCRACARYRRHLLALRAAIRLAFQAEDVLEDAGPRLPIDARRRIQEALRM